MTSGYKFESREGLVTAVYLWTGDETSALETYGDINTWDVSAITDFSYLFHGANYFNDDIGDWDVSNGRTFERMFYQAINFNQDISSWDVSKGNNFSCMFLAASLDEPIFFNQFNQDIK